MNVEAFIEYYSNLPQADKTTFLLNMPKSGMMILIGQLVGKILSTRTKVDELKKEEE